MEPLIAAEETRGVLPAAVAVTAESELLGERVHALALLQTEVIGRHVVLIHKHLVFQVLVAGGGGEEQLLRIVADGEPRVEHVALIAVQDGGGRVLYLQTIWLHRTVFYRLKLTVAEAVLRDPLVVGGPVELQLRSGLEDEPQLASGLKALVVLLVEVLVIDESLQSAVESGGRESQLVARAMIVGHFDVSP